jgi:heme/copper-type cytochrome/quinol oxidase subunit 4
MLGPITKIYIHLLFYTLLVFLHRSETDDETMKLITIIVTCFVIRQ